MIRRPLVSLAILLVTAALLVSFSGKLSRGEENYVSLLVPEEKTADVEAYLAGKGIGPFYDGEKPVIYSDFTALAAIPLKDVSRRFLEEDRRYDPYLRELGELFTTHRGNRIFFRTDLSQLALQRMLFPLRHEVLWEQAVSPLSFILIAVMAVILLGVNVYRHGSAFLWPLMVQTLWIPFYFYEPGYSLAALPLILFWEVLIIESWGQWVRAFFLFLLIAVSGAVMFSGSTLKLCSLMLALSFSVGLFLKLRFFPASPERGNREVKRAVIIKRRFSFFSHKTEHDLFEPKYFGMGVPVVSRSLTPMTAVRGNLLIPTLFLSLPLLFVPQSSENHSPFTFPGPGDFYDHVYYQQNILYSSPWGSRDPVVTSDFTWDSDTGAIIEQEKRIASFTPEWMAEVRSEYGRGYADSFLLSLPTGMESIPINFTLPFYKFRIFVIIIMFFLSELVSSQRRIPGKEKKSLQIIKRGREVA